MERSVADKKDYGILNERGYKGMETVVIVSIGIIGLVAVNYMVTQKNVRKHITEISFGKIFKFKTETEFSK